MNVTEMMKKINGNEIYTAAYIMDASGVEEIEAAYQEAWDSGNGFTAATIFKKREDDEEEMKECANQMQSALKDLIMKKWLSEYSRDEIVSFCNLLLKGPQKLYTRVRLVADLEMDVSDITREWNKVHPEECPVYLPDPDIW